MDLCAVVQRDHEDIDNALSALLNPATPPAELPGLLDVLRLALAVHTVAEGRVLDDLWALETRPSNALRPMIAQIRSEHARHHEMAEALSDVEPSNVTWYARVLRLRVDLLEHARRHVYMRGALDRHLDRPQQRALVAKYMTERLRVLGSTAPIITARQQLLPAAS